MRNRIMLLLLIVAVTMFATIAPAFAATTEFTGTFTHSDPFLEGVTVADSDDCSEAGSIDDFDTHYHVIDFNAPVTGAYEYVNYYTFWEDLSGAASGGSRSERSSGAPSRDDIPEGALIDVVIQVYASGTFDPSDTLANCLASADDYGVFNLAAGDYDIVVLTYYEDDAGDYYFTITGPDAESPACTNPQPTDAVIYNIPAGAPTFYEPSLGASTGFNLPAGTWYVSEFSGDFAQVWISCQADFVWVPTNAVAR